MRSIWKGTISFGLVTIPITLFSAVRREELKFRMLRKSDLSPLNFKRVAAVDGKEVPWEEIVKGYEYEKDKFVILKDEDFSRVDVEATQSVDILHFVEVSEVSPLLFYKPYYMEPGKGADKAYVLLRDVLEETGKIAIAKVVIKTRQYLAAVKPREKGLMLELMYFPSELVESSKFAMPEEKTPGKPERNMALRLVESMTTPWEPENYTDDYREAVMKMIDEKTASGENEAPAKPRARRSTNVIDLVSVLQKSIEQTGGAKARSGSKKPVPAKSPAKAKVAKKPPTSRKKSPPRKRAKKVA